MQDVAFVAGQADLHRLKVDVTMITGKIAVAVDLHHELPKRQHRLAYNRAS
jgi:hypothetical protein